MFQAETDSPPPSPSFSANLSYCVGERFESLRLRIVAQVALTLQFFLLFRFRNKTDTGNALFRLDAIFPISSKLSKGKAGTGADFRQTPSPAFRPFLIRPHRPAAFLGRNEISSALHATQSLGI
jgi:hypothetical protein